MYVRLAGLLAVTFLAAQTFNSMQNAAAQPDFSPSLPEEMPTIAAATNPDGFEFLIAGGDGYGATECLATKGECGQIVADAWCESKGYVKAGHYRPAEKADVTASTGRYSADQAFVITCVAPK